MELDYFRFSVNNFEYLSRLILHALDQVRIKPDGTTYSKVTTISALTQKLGFVPKVTYKKIGKLLSGKRYKYQCCKQWKHRMATVSLEIRRRSKWRHFQQTSLNFDKTSLLENLLEKEFGGSEDLLLGELQFAFITFLMGQSLEGFLQWKSLTSLLFECTEAPFHTRSQLFTKFIKVIYHQLKYGLQKEHSNNTGAEAGSSTILDESWFSADSFLYHLCKEFFSLVQEAPVVDGDLLTWARKLENLLENNLGWRFQKKGAVDGIIYFDENDEFAPVVEMLDDADLS